MDAPSSSDTPVAPSGRASGAAGYRVLARKYRPQTFDDLVGQEPMVQTLRNAFDSGRIAQAWMLTGVRGVGKTTTARILARGLNYEIPGEIERPTVSLERPGIHCAAIMDGRHVDVIEMDAASHTGIDDIREITEAARYRPAAARYKVYIIDEVHMLSKSAFNGLLKTLEEPPEHVKFIFATTEIRKVPVTVLSRCQRFDLRRIEAATLAGLLRRIATAEGIDIADEALALIARAGEGSARDSLSLLDQAIAHGGGGGAIGADTVRTMLGLADRARIIDLFEALMAGDAARALAEFRAQYDVGADPVVVLSDLAEFTHLVTRLKIVPAAGDEASVTEVERRRGRELAERLSLRLLSRCWQMLLKGIAEVQAAPKPQLAADMVLVRIAYAADLPDPEEALKLLRGGAAAELAAGLPAAPASEAPPSGRPSAEGGPASAASLPAASLAPASLSQASLQASRPASFAPQPLSPAPVSAAAGLRSQGHDGAAPAVASMPSASASASGPAPAAGGARHADPASPGAVARPASVAPRPSPPGEASEAQPAQGQPAQGQTVQGQPVQGQGAARRLQVVGGRDAMPAAGVLSAGADRPDAARPLAAPGEAPSSGPRLASLADCAALAAERRDIRLKVEIERHMRLVRFEPGRIEFQPTAEADPDLAGRLGRKLGEWTGARWLVTVSRTQGRPTLHEEREATRHQMVSDARSEPAVAALLEAFPGARIVDVRVAAVEEEPLLPPAELDSGPGGEETDPDV